MDEQRVQPQSNEALRPRTNFRRTLLVLTSGIVLSIVVGVAAYNAGQTDGANTAGIICYGEKTKLEIDSELAAQEAYALGTQDQATKDQAILDDALIEAYQEGIDDQFETDVLVLEEEKAEAFKAGADSCSISAPADNDSSNITDNTGLDGEGIIAGTITDDLGEMGVAVYDSSSNNGVTLYKTEKGAEIICVDDTNGVNHIDLTIHNPRPFDSDQIGTMLDAGLLVDDNANPVIIYATLDAENVCNKVAPALDNFRKELEKRNEPTTPEA